MNTPRFSILTLALFFLATPSLYAQNVPAPSEMHSAYGAKLEIAGVHNAGKINEHLLRGAQPKDQGFENLKHLGVTTVVDLRGEDRTAIEWERQKVEGLGMHFVSIPIGGLSAPRDKQVVEFLRLLQNPGNDKVFVHCYYGEDRTGVFVATYRMAIEHWSEAEAMHEMSQFGFNSFWQRSMKSFVRDFPNRLREAPLYSELRLAEQKDSAKAALPGAPN